MRTRPFTRRLAGFGAALTVLAGLGLTTRRRQPTP